MAETIITGFVEEEIFLYKKISWKVNTPLIDDLIFSPSFYFGDVVCQLSLSPNGINDDSELFGARLFIMLEKSHHIISNLSLLANGSKSKVYPKLHNTAGFQNGMFIYYGFEKKLLSGGHDITCPLNYLTVFCELKTHENSSEGNFLQTEMPKDQGNSVITISQDQSFIKDLWLTECFSGNEKQFYSEKLISDLNRLRLSEIDSDVTIKVKGHDFKAHRNILGARTPVFTSMFKHDMTEKATGIVIIEDCEPGVLEDFLKYIYTGKVNSQPENVPGLYHIADKYEVNELKSECLKRMMNNLSTDTFCDAIGMALLHSEKELLNLATDYFCKNTKKILLTVKWQKFLKENPIYANELFLKLV